ncbi:MAG: ATPase [Caulobacteraceae bacterium]|nr:ATPase [Caulobacter sp.]
MSSGPLAGQPGASFPKRFYKEATVAAEAGGFALRLDGRPARTPSRSPLVLPSAALAAAIADEWAAVETVIDPRDMPLTRLANSVIDGVSRTMPEVRGEILRYAGSDLLAYRAPDSAALVADQRAAWDPVIDWARERFAAEVATGAGVMFIAQPPELETRLGAALDEAVDTGAAAPFRLGALHVVTTLTGSTLLALAVALGRLDAEAAWAAAHVDEDFQIAQWGADAEAATRRAGRWAEMRAAAQVLTALRH